MFRVGTLTVAAGQVAQLNVKGDWFCMTDCNGAPPNISFGDLDPMPIPLRAMVRKPFTQLIFDRTGSALDSTFDYMYGTGDPPFDLRSREDGLGLFVPMADKTLTGNQTTKILSGAKNFYRVHLRVMEGPALGIRLGDSTVTSGNGLYVAAGEYRVIRCSSDLWAHNMNAVGTSVTVTFSVEQGR